MIVFQRIWKDLVVHFVIVFILLAFIQRIGIYERLFMSLAAALLLTLINHVFLPWLRLDGEGFQGCNLRWGVPPAACPFRASCPHRPTCDFARTRTLSS